MEIKFRAGPLRFFRLSLQPPDAMNPDILYFTDHVPRRLTSYPGGRVHGNPPNSWNISDYHRTDHAHRPPVKIVLDYIEFKIHFPADFTKYVGMNSICVYLIVNYIIGVILHSLSYCASSSPYVFIPVFSVAYFTNGILGCPLHAFPQILPSIIVIIARRASSSMMYKDILRAHLINKYIRPTTLLHSEQSEECIGFSTIFCLNFKFFWYGL